MQMREVKAVDKLQLPLTLRFAAAYLQKGLEVSHHCFVDMFQQTGRFIAIS